MVAIDRLGRNTVDVLSNVESLQTRGVRVVSLREGFDLSTPIGKAMLTMMAGLADLEKDLISERRKAGIERAKAEGVHMGRPVKASSEAVQMKWSTKTGHRVRVFPVSIFRFVWG